jgi:hypothetical protein
MTVNDDLDSIGKGERPIILSSKVLGGGISSTPDIMLIPP